MPVYYSSFISHSAIQIPYNEGLTNHSHACPWQMKNQGHQKVKVFDFFVNILSCSLFFIFQQVLNSKFVTGMGMRDFVNMTLLCFSGYREKF
jgi:hypothetical protein